VRGFSGEGLGHCRRKDAAGNYRPDGQDTGGSPDAVEPEIAAGAGRHITSIWIDPKDTLSVRQSFRKVDALA
jgi:hypothetical protein